MRPIDEKAKGRDKGERIGLCLNLQDRARGRISCYEAVASHRSVIHIPDVWRCPARRQENLHTASKRWTSVYPCAVALFGKESSVTRDPERLARISGWTWTIYTLERGPHEVYDIKDTTRCGELRDWAYALRNPKRKRSNGPFPTVENSNVKIYIVLKNIYCFGKQVLTIFHFTFYLSFLFVFVSGFMDRRVVHKKDRSDL